MERTLNLEKEALVSGVLGKALFKENGQHFLIDTQNNRIPVDEKPEAALFLSFGGEADIFPYNKIDDVVSFTQKRHQNFECLTLLSYLVTPEIQGELKNEISDRLELLLFKGDNNKFLLNRLMSAYDEEATRRLEEAAKTLTEQPRVLGILDHAVKHQHVVREIRTLFEEYFKGKFPRTEYEEIDQLLTDRGIFSGLVQIATRKAAVVLDIDGMDERIVEGINFIKGKLRRLRVTGRISTGKTGRRVFSVPTTIDQMTTFHLKRRLKRRLAHVCLDIGASDKSDRNQIIDAIQRISVTAKNIRITRAYAFFAVDKAELDLVKESIKKMLILGKSVELQVVRHYKFGGRLKDPKVFGPKKNLPAIQPKSLKK
jgi:hypothetical protein